MGIMYKQGRILCGNEYIEGNILISPKLISDTRDNYISLLYRYDKNERKMDYYLWNMKSCNYDNKYMIPKQLNIDSKAELLGTSLLIKLYFDCIDRDSDEITYTPIMSYNKYNEFIKNNCEIEGDLIKIKNEFIFNLQNKIDEIKVKRLNVQRLG